MRTGSGERGQALILIVFGLIVMIGLTGLAVDGGMAYSDRRKAQNAADNAALAAALERVRGGVVQTVADTSALTNGFDNNGTTNTVTVTEVDSTHCPFFGTGKDITVKITSVINAYFGPVIGIRQMHNTVQATARSCDAYVGPLFNGNAIVALTPGGIGFDAAGNPAWNVLGGGIFSNSSSSPSVRCKGASDVSAPSVTAVGVIALQCSNSVGSSTSGAAQYQYADYAGLLPRSPACNGTASLQNGYWVPESGADGSKVAFNGNMVFGAGLYCVTNSPGPYHGAISGTGVTFFIMPSNFSMKFNGGGNLTATPPLSGEYQGLLIFSAPQLSGGVLQNTQSIDLRGNGTADIKGSIIMPSASVTMFGNSNSNGLQTQVIGYNVDSGGTSNIYINYNATGGYQTMYPAWLTLLK